MPVLGHHLWRCVSAFFLNLLLQYLFIGHLLKLFLRLLHPFCRSLLLPRPKRGTHSSRLATADCMTFNHRTNAPEPELAFLLPQSSLLFSLEHDPVFLGTALQALIIHAKRPPGPRLPASVHPRRPIVPTAHLSRLRSPFALVVFKTRMGRRASEHHSHFHASAPPSQQIGVSRFQDIRQGCENWKPQCPSNHMLGTYVQLPLHSSQLAWSERASLFGRSSAASPDALSRERTKSLSYCVDKRASPPHPEISSRPRYRSHYLQPSSTHGPEGADGWRKRGKEKPDFWRPSRWDVGVAPLRVSGTLAGMLSRERRPSGCDPELAFEATIRGCPGTSFVSQADNS